MNGELVCIPNEGHFFKAANELWEPSNWRLVLQGPPQLEGAFTKNSVKNGSTQTPIWYLSWVSLSRLMKRKHVTWLWLKAQVFSTFSPNLGPGSTPKTQSDSKSLSLVPHHNEFSFFRWNLKGTRFSQFPIQESDRAGTRSRFLRSRSSQIQSPLTSSVHVTLW